MKQSLTKQLLEWLLLNGYNYLVAEDQAQFDCYEFTPVRWNIDDFQNATMDYAFDKHIVISIADALLSFHLEDYSNHDVILTN